MIILPTRRSRIRPGETTLAGKIGRVSPGVPVGDLRIKLNRATPASSLETRTQSNGEFFFFIPFPVGFGGSVPVETETASIEVRGPDGTLLTGLEGQPVTIITGKSIFVRFDL